MLAILLSACVATACGAGDGPPDTRPTADPEAPGATTPDAAGSSPGAGQGAYSIVDSLRDELMQAWDAGDAEAFAAPFAADGSITLPSGETAEGPDAIRTLLQAHFRETEVALQLELVSEGSRIVDAELFEDEGTFRMSVPEGGGREGGEASGAYEIRGRLGEGGLRITSARFEVGSADS